MSKKLLTRQYFFTSGRFFSSSSTNLGHELVKAKPFESVPKLSVYGLLRGFMPGGDYHGLELQDIHAVLRKKYGKIVQFPAFLGRPSIVFTYDAEDFEKVIRSHILNFVYLIRKFIVNLNTGLSK